VTARGFRISRQAITFACIALIHHFGGETFNSGVAIGALLYTILE
jgi:hypothetical protein